MWRARIVRPRRRRTNRRHQRVREHLDLTAAAGSGYDAVTPGEEVDETRGQVHAGRLVAVRFKGCERRRRRADGGELAAKDTYLILRTGTGADDDVVRRPPINLRGGDAHAAGLRGVERLETRDLG